MAMKMTGESGKRYGMKRVMWGLLCSGNWGVGLSIVAQIYMKLDEEFKMDVDCSPCRMIKKSKSTLQSMNFSQQSRPQIYFPQFTQCDCLYCPETGPISVDSILFKRACIRRGFHRRLFIISTEGLHCLGTL